MMGKKKMTKKQKMAAERRQREAEREAKYQADSALIASNASIKQMQALSKQYASVSNTSSRQLHPFLHDRNQLLAMAREGPSTFQLDKEILCPIYPEDEQEHYNPNDKVKNTEDGIESKLETAEKTSTNDDMQLATSPEWLAMQQKRLRHLSKAWKCTQKAYMLLQLTRYPTKTNDDIFDWECTWREAPIERRKRLGVTALAYAFRVGQTEFPVELKRNDVMLELCPKLLDVLQDKEVDAVQLARDECQEGDDAFNNHVARVKKLWHLHPKLEKDSIVSQHSYDRSVAFYTKLAEFVYVTWLLCVAEHVRCGHCQLVQLLNQQVAKDVNYGKRTVMALCARCHLQNYCSRECQTSAWPKHKKFCVPHKKK